MTVQTTHTGPQLLVKQTKAGWCRRSTGWLRQSFLEALRYKQYKSVRSLVGFLRCAWSSCSAGGEQVSECGVEETEGTCTPLVAQALQLLGDEGRGYLHV